MSGAVSTIKKPFTGGGGGASTVLAAADPAPAADAVAGDAPAVQTARNRTLFAGAAGEISRGGNEADTLGRPRRRSASRELLG
jgi:hypothetical protein